ncbi:MAG: hypothetical protein ACLS90_08640 [Clostridia bacterium]|nr:MAG: hypothetical protein BHW07_03760 [Clostridium sp. CAG_433_25_7]
MEYAKEILPTLREKKTSKYKINKRVINCIARHRWITIIITLLMILSVINGLMIYNFFKILQTL